MNKHGSTNSPDIAEPADTSNPPSVVRDVNGDIKPSSTDFHGLLVHRYNSALAQNRELIDLNVMLKKEFVRLNLLIEHLQARAKCPKDCIECTALKKID